MINDVLQLFEEYAESPCFRNADMADISQEIQNDLELLSKFSLSKEINAMQVMKIFDKMIRGTKFSAEQLLFNDELLPALEKGKEIWNMLHDPEVVREEDNYMASVTKLIQNSTDFDLSDDAADETFRDTFLDVFMSAARRLSEAQLEIYKKASVIKFASVPHFHTRFLLFERMADCILYLEQKEDGIYPCLIRQFDQGISYFAFVIKTNENMFSLHERLDIPFRYIRSGGQRIMPSFSQIVSQERLDTLSKEYRTSLNPTYHMLDIDAFDLSQFDPGIYRNVLMAMFIIQSKYDSVTLEGEEVYLNTFLENNYLVEHRPEDLSILQRSQIAKHSLQYQLGIDLKKAASPYGYNKEFGFKGDGSVFVELYGEGFMPDISNIMSSCEEEKVSLANGEELKTYHYFSECIGSQEYFDKIFYEFIRIQFAEYIDAQMLAEYKQFRQTFDWGENSGKESILMLHTKETMYQRERKEYWCHKEPEEYWYRKAQKMKPKLISMICQKRYQETTGNVVNSGQIDISRIEKRRSQREWCIFNTNLYHDTKAWKYEGLDEITNTKCTNYYILHFDTCKQMEDFIEEKLPKIYQTYGFKRVYHSDADRVSLLDNLCSGCFDLCIGFSNKGFEEVYKEWLISNGHEDELERMKQEKIVARKLKAEKDAKAAIKETPDAFSSHDYHFETYRNDKQIEATVQELRSVVNDFDPDLQLDCYNGNDVAYQIKVSIPVRGNKKAFDELKRNGWHRYYGNTKSVEGRKYYIYYKTLAEIKGE